MSSRLSIRERLQGVSTEEQLDQVMRDLWAFGSPNWTFDATIRFLPSNLWGALGKYFDRSGRLVARVPERQGPDGRPDTLLLEPEDEVHPELPGGGWLRTESLSALIASFHGRLAEVRRKSRPVVRVGARVVEAAGPVAEELPDDPHESAVREPEPDLLVAIAPDPGPQPEETGYLCPICLQRHPELVDFRGKDVCQPCMQLLRGY